MLLSFSHSFITVELPLSSTARVRFSDAPTITALPFIPATLSIRCRPFQSIHRCRRFCIVHVSQSAK